jgi:hypothetical protein
MDANTREWKRTVDGTVLIGKIATWEKNRAPKWYSPQTRKAPRRQAGNSHFFQQGIAVRRPDIVFAGSGPLVWILTNGFLPGGKIRTDPIQNLLPAAALRQSEELNCIKRRAQAAQFDSSCLHVSP